MRAYIGSEGAGDAARESQGACREPRCLFRVDGEGLGYLDIRVDKTQRGVLREQKMLKGHLPKVM